jgi:hypothetical protein
MKNKLTNTINFRTERGLVYGAALSMFWIRKSSHTKHTLLAVLHNTLFKHIITKPLPLFPNECSNSTT